jgi:hypothetical protein
MSRVMSRLADVVGQTRATEYRKALPECGVRLRLHGFAKFLLKRTIGPCLCETNLALPFRSTSRVFFFRIRAKNALLRCRVTSHGHISYALVQVTGSHCCRGACRTEAALASAA